MQAIEQLPEHLQRAVLSHAPLHHCLVHLPDTWHPSTLHSHHPSIDSHRSLHVTHLTPAAMPPALAAIATFTHLSDISLAGLTLPPLPASAFGLLTTLRDLTALSLRNTCLSDAAAAALAPVLPSMSRLAGLDLSDNLITAPVIQVLSPALALCTGLRALNLAQTMPFTNAGYSAIESLARSVPSFQFLTSLSLGGRKGMQRSCLGYSFCDALTRLLEALSCISSLRQLALRFRFKVPADRVAVLAEALAAVQKLHQLSFTIPAIKEQVDEVDMQAWAEVAAGADAHLALPHAIASLSALTAVELSTEFILGKQERVAAHLLCLTALTGLQHLSLQHMVCLDDAPARSLFLTSLTALTHMRSLHVSVWHITARHIPMLAAIAEAACALPRLHRLHMPVLMLADAQRRHLPALLRFRCTGELTLELKAGRDPTTRAPQDLTPFVALIPYATSLEIDRAGEDDEWLRALVPAITAHPTLCSLSVIGLNVPKQGVVQDLLDAAAGLCSLRCLAVRTSGNDGDVQVLELNACVSRLRHCTALTELQLEVCRHMPHVEAYEELPRLAPLCAALPGLRKVGLGVYVPETHAECVAALSQLTLHTLAVTMAEPDDATMLVELLGHLPHLRSLGVAGMLWPLQRHAISYAAAQLPACHHVAFGYGVV